MIRKTLLSVALFIIIVSLTSCGGGTGSSSTPQGVNPGVPSVVQLLPVSFVAKTNSSITFNARVLNGNGTPLQNIPVTFTNLTSVGTFQSAFEDSGVTTFAAGPTVVLTDNLGYARINVFSSSVGWVTLLAQVDEGVTNPRDKKTVYYTSNNVFQPRLTLDVNSDPGNETYNETSDVTMFEAAFDDTVEVLATDFDIADRLVSGDTMTWGTDQAEATFERTETVTNTSGQANAFVAVDQPLSLRNAVTHVNVWANSGIGGFNMVTLFLNPVIVDIISGRTTLTASPPVVETGETSTITALIFLNTGAPIPDGITVNFTTAPTVLGTDPSPCGSVTPFGQTSGGVATTIFTPPLIPGSCTITASISGIVIGTVTVTVTTPLAIFPDSATIDGAAGGTLTFTISGGIPPYTVVSSNPAITATLGADGVTITVTVPAGSAGGSVTITARDAALNTATATVTIIAPAALQVTPSSLTMSCSAVSPNGPVFTVSGGIVGAGYSILSLNTAIIAVSTATVATDPGTFRADAVGTACATMTTATLTTIDVDVTVTDTGSPASSETVTLTVTNP